jgi:hypothetical protein
MRAAVAALLILSAAPAFAQGRDAVSKYQTDATAGFGPAAVRLLWVFGSFAAVGLVGFAGWLLLPRLIPSPTPESDPWVKAQLAKQGRSE